MTYPIRMPARHFGITCNAMVEGGGLMSYRCQLAAGHHEHGEPHYALENNASVRRWTRWMEEQEVVDELPVTVLPQPDPDRVPGACVVMSPYGLVCVESDGHEAKHISADGVQWDEGSGPEDQDPVGVDAANQDEILKAIQAERARVVAMLVFLADARSEYVRVKAPEHRGEIEQMDTADLMIWVESTTAKQLAALITNPSSAWGWLPSWRWDEWAALTDPTR